MKTNRLILTLSIVLGFAVANAQKHEKEYYFVVNNDTTFCKELKYSANMQGYLNEVEYIDMQGKSVKLKGKKDVPDVTTFYMDGVVIDKVPLKADKPDGYIRYTQRVADGKLKVYLAQQGYNKTWQTDLNRNPTPMNPTGMSMVGPAGIYRFYIKMPDGVYYQINDKANMNGHIKPFLLKCVEFKNQYKGDFSTKEQPFIDMIKLYNSVCE